MPEEFKEQGGIATMDPSPLRRWMVSRVMSRLFTPSRIEQRRVAAEKDRVRRNQPHRVVYFHQVDDGYSHLAAQLLQRLAARYAIELDCHLVAAPQGKNVAEPDLLLRLSRYDSHLIAPGQPH